MSDARTIRLDAVIFGGGATGLWTLDVLRRAGHSAVVLEAGELGAGQTVVSQGIIHGGLKYTLDGLLSPSARSLRDMPRHWRRCLAGEEAPDLSATRRRADFCHLWRTAELGSRLAMFGARRGLQTATRPLDAAARPAVLRSCPGSVARLEEQVIDPDSLLSALAGHHPDRVLGVDVTNGLEIETTAPGHVDRIRLIDPASGAPLDVLPERVILAAGGGNATLREQCGLDATLMQRRPLHMVLA
ncbi:MAG: FAD-dependent oxidoreductase, partial [Phycisphaerae bacterium]|nr:FAD-dependent oxidoreductase [Phycisphaerae bacterium]